VVISASSELFSLRGGEERFSSNLQVSGSYNRLILVLAFMHHGEQSVQTSKRMCTLTEGSRVFLYSVCSIFWWSGFSELWGVHALCTQSCSGEIIHHVSTWWVSTAEDGLQQCQWSTKEWARMIALYESAWWHHHHRYCGHVIMCSCPLRLEWNNFCSILK